MHRAPRDSLRLRGLWLTCVDLWESNSLARLCWQLLLVRSLPRAAALRTMKIPPPARERAQGELAEPAAAPAREAVERSAARQQAQKGAVRRARVPPVHRAAPMAAAAERRATVPGLAVCRAASLDRV